MSSAAAWSTVVALGAASAYAVASVLQHRSARAEPQTRLTCPTLLLRLIRRPLWLVGTASSGIGIALQILALSLGPLILVQPMIAAGLLIAVILDSMLDRRRPEVAALSSATIAVLGLAMFVVAAEPRGGQSADQYGLLLIGVLASAAVMVAGAALGRRFVGTTRAVAYGLAVGVAYGASAALLKATLLLVGREGWQHVVLQWQAYALIVFATVGLALNQHAYQLRPLQATLVALTVADPVVAALLGWLGLGEGIRTNPVRLSVTLAAVLMMAAGIVLTSRYLPVVAQERCGLPSDRLATHDPTPS